VTLNAVRLQSLAQNTCLIYSGFIYSFRRAESGNAISKENPSLVAGAAGGCGSASFGWPEPLATADFVCAPIGSFVTTGGSQAGRVARTVLQDLIGCIIRLRNRVNKLSLGKPSMDKSSIGNSSMGSALI
jgi:hypothetical protein